MVKLLQMRVFSRTIIFSILSLIFASLPASVNASIVSDTVSNFTSFYVNSTDSLVDETVDRVKGVVKFYSPLASETSSILKGAFDLTYTASDSILNGIVSLGRSAMDSTEYSIARTGEGWGGVVASASSAISSFSKSDSIEKEETNSKNSVASGYGATKNINFDFTAFKNLPNKVLNIYSVVGNSVLKASEYSLTRTGDALGNSFISLEKMFDVVDKNFDEATVALGSAGYQGVANLYTASKLISNSLLDVQDFFVNTVASSVTDTSKQVAGVGSFFKSFMDKLSDPLVPLFTDKTPNSNISSNFVDPKPNVSRTNTNTSVALPGTNTITERIIERSSYPVYSLNSLDSLRAELVSLNASSVEYLKGLINRSEYRTSESIYKTTDRSGGSSGSVTSVDASGGTTGLTFTGGPVTSSGTLTLAGTLAIANGGTGLTTAPTYGQLFMGNSSGTYDLVATSSLGITSGSSVTGSTGQLAYFSGTDAAVGTSTISISTAGNVGIGTASPVTQLQTTGTININNGVASTLVEALRFSQAGYASSYTSSIYAQQDSTAALNIIQFRLDNGDGSTKVTPLTLVGTGNVGIGTTTPYGLLSVNPNGISGPSFVVGSSTATNFVVTNGGNVGIGTASPLYKLDIGNNTSEGVRIGVAAVPGATGTLYFGSQNLTGANAAGSISGTYGSSYDGYLAFSTKPAGGGWNGDLTERMRIDNAGNVGIGTASPSYKLDVIGMSSITAQAGEAGSSTLRLITEGLAQGERAGISFYPTFQGTGDSAPRRAADIIAGYNGGAWGNEYLSFRVGGAGDNDAANLNAERIRITGTGLVGIGRSTPQTKLEIHESSDATIVNTFSLNNTGGSVGTGNRMTFVTGGNGEVQTGAITSLLTVTGSPASGDLYFSTLRAGTLTEGLRLTADGNVGIGTTTPFAKLSVAGSGYFDGNLTATNITATGTATVANLVINDGASGGYLNMSGVGQASPPVALNYGMFPYSGVGVGFKSQAGGYGFWNNSSEILRIAADGNVGIGTTNPHQKLEVQGSTSGDIAALLVSAGADSANRMAGVGFSTRASNGDGVFKSAIYHLQRTSDDWGRGDLGFAVDGALDGGSAAVSDEKMRLTYEGNLGIGTTTPFTKLGVAGSGYFDGNLTSTNITATGTLSVSGTMTAAGAISTGDNFITTAGRFISGAVNSSGALNGGSVFGGGSTGPRNVWGATTNDDNPNTGMGMNISSGGNALSVVSLTSTAGGAWDPTTTGTIMTYLSSGNVGIGTTTPGSLLSVGNTNGINFSTATSTFSSTGGINLAAGCFAVNGVCVGSGGGGSSLTGSTGQLAYFSGTDTAVGTSTVFISTAEKVGIGIASPAYKLEVNGSASTTALYMPRTTAAAVGTLNIGTVRIHTYEDNLFFGINAGNFSSSGASGNIGFGTNVFQYLSGGDYNTSIGHGALGLLSGGSGNVAIGSSALGYNGTGNNNVAIGGANTGLNVSGSNNILIGYETGQSLSSGSNNLAIGYSVGLPSNTASNQMTIGNLIFGTGLDGTGTTISTGKIGIGITSPNYKFEVNGSASTTALYMPKTTSSSIGVLYSGTDRLMHTYGGDTNFFAGVTAGNFTLSGTYNVGIGYQALDSLTSGTANTAIGYTAFGAGTSGGSNTAIGYQALQVNNGDLNVGVGRDALTLNTGSNNVGIGYYSLGASGNGSNNIGIGYTVADNLTAGSGNIFIGNQIDAPSSTGSNQLSIGNLIFGTGLDGTGTTISTGKIGIGTTTPWGQLSVNPNGISGPSFVVGSSTATSFIIKNNGNLGVGTTSTQTNTKLTIDYSLSSVSTPVNGVYSYIYNDDTANTAAGRFIGTGWGENTYGIYAKGDGQSETGNTYGIYGEAINNAGGGSIGVYGSGNVGVSGYSNISSGFALQATQGNSSGYAIYSSGGKNYFGNNVGIGTTTPSAKLSITQSANTNAGGLWIAETGNTDFRSIFMNTSGIMSFYGGDTGGTLNTATLNAAGEWTNASDRTYKDNIEDLSYGLEDLMKLNPRSYTMKNTDLKRVGFIAQEVESIIPEVVAGEEGSKGISYGNLVAVVVKAVQELKIQLDSILAWFSDGKFSVQNEVCVDDVCVTKEEFKQILLNNGGGITVTPEPTPTPEPEVILEPEVTPEPDLEIIPEPEPLNDSQVESSGEHSEEQNVLVEPTPEPEPEVAPEVEPTPDPEPEPEQVSAPELTVEI